MKIRKAPATATTGLRRTQLLRHESIVTRERQRISRDLHDGLGQDLFALKLALARFYARTGTAHPHLHANAGQLLRLVDDLLANVRSSIEDLRPDALALGLDEAIRRQVDKCLQRSGEACHFELHLDPVALRPEVATAAFRILQEALTNVCRHAQASEVRVELVRRGGALLLSVTDNGCGFAPGAPRRQDAFGLAGMRERVAALGGRLDIDSAPGRGTVLTVAVPLRKTGARSGKAYRQTLLPG